MNETKPRRKVLPWEELRTRLDEGPPFNTMRGTPYYRDAVYEQFSKAEYARRYEALSTSDATPDRLLRWALDLFELKRELAN